MSSESPRVRIDKFFASRKRSRESPRGSKAEKKDPKTLDEGSPSAKGSLVGYLVRSSPDDNRRNFVGDVSRPEVVKRNLLSSIDEGKKTVLRSCSTADESLSRNADRPVGDVKDSSNAVNLEGIRCKETTGLERHRNSELKRFASDFLSLYCSDVPPAVNVTAEQEAKSHKRDGSPSLVVDCGKSRGKKQCVVGVDLKDGPILSELKMDNIINDVAGGQHAEFDVALKKDHDEKTDGIGSGLKRCNSTPVNSRRKTGLCTPNILNSVKSRSRTPKSSVRNSLLSPGDDFWNEAIQVADGLFPVVDGIKNDHSPKGLSSDVPKDQSSCAVNQHSRHFSRPVTGNIGASVLASSSSTHQLEMSISEAKLSSKVSQKQKEASPLPVKHFDFSHEDSLCQKIRKKDGDDISTNNGPSFISSSKHVFLNNSPLVVDSDGNGDNGSNLDKEVPTRPISNSSPEEIKTPSSSMPSKYRLQLNRWLPSEVCSIYTKKGILQLYPWQVECLLVDGVLEKRNLVYCASTSAGKSFVAEILMLRRVLSTGKMAMLVLPYVSICAEKAEHLELLLEPLGKHVRSFYGTQGGGSLPKDTSVAVCTIEKANSLVNRLLEEGRLSELGIIVIDELHMVADQHRGYLLELMLTKLRYAAGEGSAASSSGESSGASSGKTDPAQGLQIVGMSATMPNVAAVADWLHAALYQTDFRPVPLEEYIKVGNTIFDKNMSAIRVIRKGSELDGKDPDHIVELCNEVVQEGHSVLLFCSSRKGCESTAMHVSKFIKKFSLGTHGHDSDFIDISAAIETLRKSPAGLDPILEQTIPTGVAYHHAGLTVEEREIVESCYRKGLVRVLTATSTLAAGVNLPARRVIFRQPMVGRDFIDGTRYRQMAGRAGRTGIDTKGESILICKPCEAKRITTMLNESCPPLHSCLSEDKNGMTHAIMEVVAGGIVQTAHDIDRYVRCTLLNSTKPFQDVVKSAQDSLRWLCHKRFLDWNEETKLYSTTPLGRAAFGSSLTPEESLIVLDDLSRARESFVLASDLHLVYLVTPINVEFVPDWELYYERFMELPAIDQSVGNRVGVTESFLMRMAHGAPVPINNMRGKKKNGLHDKLQTRNAANATNVLLNEQAIRVSKRFYVALMLSRLVQEVPVADVCEAFKVARGMIQALQENAGRFALMVSVFCERLGWHDLEALISKFHNRVAFGVRAEIAELTTIPFVKGSRARALYKSGLRTPVTIAEASVSEIAKAIFETSSWAGYNDTALRRMQLGVAKKIKNGARKIVFEQAEQARVAAFSAFKSLGLDVPQISRPFVATDTKESPTGKDLLADKEDAREAQNERSRTSFPDKDQLRLDTGCAFPVANQQTLEELKDSAFKAPKSTSSVGLTHHNSIPINPGTLIKDSLLVQRDNSGQGSGTLLIPELGASSAGLAHAKGIELDSQLDTGREKESQYSNGVSSYKGPVNVSKFPGGFDEFLDQWAAVNEFCFDLHFLAKSNQQSPAYYEVFGLSLCWENSPVYYCNFSKDLVVCSNHSVSSIWEVAKSRWTRLAKIMGCDGVRKITWNLKIQIQALKFPCISIQRLGNLRTDDLKLKDVEDIKVIDDTFILFPSISVHDGFDICLATWILWPDEESKFSPNLEKVVKKRLSSEAAAAANREGRWKSQMHRASHNGCCRRVAQVRALGFALEKLLVSEGLVEVLCKIENPLIKVLADMELWGIGVDMEGCLQARQILIRKLKELEKEAYQLAGISFSLHSSADIANVLYKHLKLSVPKGNKGKLHPSTDKHTLDLLRDQHPIISVIKEYRTLAKLLNSTLGSICSRARLHMKSQKYIILGHWLQTSTATGRLSMEEPNLQCVEHSIVFKTHQTDEKSPSGSEGHEQHQINARELFIPTQDNWLLLTADYSQIELRLMAHFSKDQVLIELLSKPDGDVFTMIASKWTSKLESAISSEERDSTKRLIYGILYGMGANSLAEQLECSPESAADKIKSFKSSFPGVSAWLSEAVASCQRKGFVETLMGRKRFLSKIQLGNGKEKAKAQRQAVNSICQGSAADVIKMAMISIHSAIVEGRDAFNAKEGFTDLRDRCRIILQVHDELVLEVDPSILSEVGSLLQESMENAVPLLVPLRVKMKVGKTWGTLEPFPPQSSNQE